MKKLQLILAMGLMVGSCSQVAVIKQDVEILNPILKDVDVYNPIPKDFEFLNPIPKDSIFIRWNFVDSTRIVYRDSIVIDTIKIVLSTQTTFEPDTEKTALIVNWEQNTESDISGYRIYLGIESGNYILDYDVNNSENYRIEGLNRSVVYYLAMTAYDFSGNESGFSDEIKISWNLVSSGN